MNKNCMTCAYAAADMSQIPCSGCLGHKTQYSKWIKGCGKEEHPALEKCYGDFRQGTTYAERECDICLHVVACKEATAAKAREAVAARVKTEPVTAPALLNRAASIMEERAKQYDAPTGERSMGRCVAAFNAITGRDLTEPEGWLLLQVLKDVRQWQKPGYHADSAEDCIAYAALKAEALANESNNKQE